MVQELKLGELGVDTGHKAEKRRVRREKKQRVACFRAVKDKGMEKEGTYAGTYALK
jgi:hypothetical protein